MPLIGLIKTNVMACRETIAIPKQLSFLDKTMTSLIAVISSKAEFLNCFLS